MDISITKSSISGPAIMLRAYLADHYDHLHRKLTRDLGCPDLASDCLHDAWLRLGDMPLPADVRRPGAYVYRVARNLAMDRLRGECRTIPLADLDDDAGPDMPDPTPGPDRTVEARSVLALLDRALSGLPYRHQCVLFDLRVEEGTRTQVAARYGLSTRRIDTLLRQSLEHCLAAVRGQSAGRQVRY